MKKKIAILVLGLFISICASQGQLSLESPFPKNKYTHALEAAMQVWSTVELLTEEQLQDEDHCFACDVLVGRLVGLYDSIGQIKKETIKTLEDLCYLYDVIASIKQQVAELPTTRSELKHAAQLWLNKITARLEKMLQE